MSAVGENVAVPNTLIGCENWFKLLENHLTSNIQKSQKCFFLWAINLLKKKKANYKMTYTSSGVHLSV